MGKLLLAGCCGIICFAYSAYAQIDLGVDDDYSVSQTGESLNQEIDSVSNNSKSFSLFEKALNLFSSNKQDQPDQTFDVNDLKQKADQGDLDAMLNLGYMYLYGTNNVSIDYAQAFNYYQKAAEKNNPVALNNLGSLYFNGIGTDVDYSKALQHFDQAAKLGSDDAAVNLAIIYLGADDKNKNKEYFEKVFQLLEQAKENNNIAKYLLGYCYYVGFQLKQDYTKAFPLIKAAAEAEYDEAQLLIADFYINGWGTPKNYNRAVQFLKNASAQGNAEAMLKLGDILAEGKIYTKDIEDAHVQYNIASVRGVDEAVRKRDELEKQIKIEDLLSIQTEAEEYIPRPSEQTAFIRQTYGDSLKAYIDINVKLAKKFKIIGD